MFENLLENLGLSAFSLKGFGPLLVTMDSHGGSLHREVTDSAKSKRDAILASIGASE